MKRLAIAMRICYLLLFSIQAWQSGITSFIFHSVVFLVSLPLFFFAKKHPKLYLSDALIIAIFASSVLLFQFGIILTSTVFGIDKFYHAAGGAAIAVLFSQLAKIYIQTKHKLVLPALVLLLTLAVGAGWEVFEWIFFHIFTPNYISIATYNDSMLDLLADSFGALLVVLYDMCKK